MIRNKPDSLATRVRAFFENNPDEALTAADLAAKFDCTPDQASVVFSYLIRHGLPESCFIRVRQRSDKRADFPGNLSACERTSVEAYAEHGTIKKAARALELSEFTVMDNLKAARAKAGVNDSVVLVARYVRAQCQQVAA